MSQLSTPQESATSLPTLKLLLIGDSGVGKSRCMGKGRRQSWNRKKAYRRCSYITHVFSPLSRPSASCSDSQKISLSHIANQPLDTAGQERFRTLTPSYYRGAQGIILVYDVTRRETFLGLESWLQELEVFTKKEVVKILVGNKIDETRHEVERREGLRFARRHSLLFAEASAKMKYGVQNIFDEVVIRILQTPGLWNIKRQGLRLTESQTLKESNSCSGLYCVVA
uniref:RAB18B, member RAS oncogene family n=1 Tax=Anolis carolinensis TaxID=28377 RepID=A0A803ST36_ANOCA